MRGGKAKDGNEDEPADMLHGWLMLLMCDVRKDLILSMVDRYGFNGG